MKFKLRFGSKAKLAGYKFTHFWNFSILFSIPFAMGLFVVYIAVLFLLIELQNEGVLLFLIGDVNDETGRSILYVMAFFTLMIEYYLIWKTSIYYVKITSKGIYLHHGNFVHYGLHQFPTINTTIPFKNIISCKIGIPVDCPPNFRYSYYNHISMIKRYFDIKRGKEVEYMKEPAIAGGRYDEECILLELDNKRIVVIPIDECEEFLELFNQYMEQYRALQNEKGEEK